MNTFKFLDSKESYSSRIKALSSFQVTDLTPDKKNALKAYALQLASLTNEIAGKALKLKKGYQQEFSCMWKCIAIMCDLYGEKCLEQMNKKEFFEVWKNCLMGQYEKELKLTSCEMLVKCLMNGSLKVDDWKDLFLSCLNVEKFLTNQMGTEEDYTDCINLIELLLQRISTSEVSFQNGLPLLYVLLQETYDCTTLPEEIEGTVQTEQLFKHKEPSSLSNNYAVHLSVIKMFEKKIPNTNQIVFMLQYKDMMKYLKVIVKIVSNSFFDLKIDNAQLYMDGMSAFKMLLEYFVYGENAIQIMNLIQTNKAGGDLHAIKLLDYKNFVKYFVGNIECIFMGNISLNNKDDNTTSQLKERALMITPKIGGIFDAIVQSEKILPEFTPYIIGMTRSVIWRIVMNFFVPSITMNTTNSDGNVIRDERTDAALLKVSLSILELYGLLEKTEEGWNKLIQKMSPLLLSPMFSSDVRKLYVELTLHLFGSRFSQSIDDTEREKYQIIKGQGFLTSFKLNKYKSDNDVEFFWKMIFSILKNSAVLQCEEKVQLIWSDAVLNVSKIMRIIVVKYIDEMNKLKKPIKSDDELLKFVEENENEYLSFVVLMMNKTKSEIVVKTCLNTMFEILIQPTIKFSTKAYQMLETIVTSSLSYSADLCNWILVNIHKIFVYNIPCYSLIIPLLRAFDLFSIDNDEKKNALILISSISSLSIKKTDKEEEDFMRFLVIGYNKLVTTFKEECWMVFWQIANSILFTNTTKFKGLINIIVQTITTSGECWRQAVKSLTYIVSNTSNMDIIGYILTMLIKIVCSQENKNEERDEFIISNITEMSLRRRSTLCGMTEAIDKVICKLVDECNISSMEILGRLLRCSISCRKDNKMIPKKGGRYFYRGNSLLELHEDDNAISVITRNCAGNNQSTIRLKEFGSTTEPTPAKTDVFDKLMKGAQSDFNICNIDKQKKQPEGNILLKEIQTLGDDMKWNKQSSYSANQIKDINEVMQAKVVAVDEVQSVMKELEQTPTEIINEENELTPKERTDMEKFIFSTILIEPMNDKTCSGTFNQDNSKNQLLFKLNTSASVKTYSFGIMSNETELSKQLVEVIQSSTFFNTIDVMKFDNEDKSSTMIKISEPERKNIFGYYDTDESRAECTIIITPRNERCLLSFDASGMSCDCIGPLMNESIVPTKNVIELLKEALFELTFKTKKEVNLLESRNQEIMKLKGQYEDKPWTLYFSSISDMF